MMASSNFSEYSNEWTITELFELEDFKATPTFSPLPRNNLAFEFQYYYKKINLPNLECSDLSLFRLKIVKKRDPVIWTPMQINLDVILKYLDGSFYKQYKTMVIRDFKLMRFKIFENIIAEHDFRSAHYNKMMNGALIIKCNMIILDDSTQSRTELESPSDLKTNVGNFSSVCNPSVLSDIEFVVDEKSLPANKVIVAAHSPVFQKRLMNEFKGTKTSRFPITSTTYEVFSSFLKFLYTCEIDNQSWPHVRELYVLAYKYNVSTLKNECRQIIPSFLNTDTVCKILILAHIYDDSELKEVAVKYAVYHIRVIFYKEDWKEMVRSYPRIGYDVTVNFVPRNEPDFNLHE